MTFLGVHIVRKYKGKFLVIRPALPAFRRFSGVGVYGPDVAVLFALVVDHQATEEYLEFSRDEGFYVVEDFIESHF